MCIRDSRQPVQTYVLEHDWGLLEDAMRRELSRGGQIYYLHNRVESIDATAARIQKMLGPEARIVTGHGKMGEQELSSVMPVSYTHLAGGGRCHGF